MNIFRVLLIVALALLFAEGVVYSVDQSICDSNSKVSLHPNGTLMFCILKSDLRMNEITCREKRPINFYADGRLESCELATAARVADQNCKDLEPISFYPDGRFKTCVKKE